MRKNAKINKNIEICRIQSYHQHNENENYSFSGFKARKYFTSDRFISLDENFQRADGKPLKGFGLEIECECGSIRAYAVLAEVFDKVIFPHFPADLFKMQHDGSLMGATSVECITQPMTKEFIRNNYKNFSIMYDKYFTAFAISAGSDSCGMHVNISNACFGSEPKKQLEAIRKLYYIINKHFDVFKGLFRRKETQYCRQMPCPSIEYAKTANFNVPSDHSVCLNLGHLIEGRIEIRLVAGQPTFQAFRNTMESIFFIVEKVKNLSWNAVDDLYKIFEGCNKYVYNRLCRFLDNDLLNKIAPTVTRDDFGNYSD